MRTGFPAETVASLHLAILRLESSINVSFMSITVLDEPRSFPPKAFYLIVWLATLVFVLVGAFVSRAGSIGFWIWIGIGLVSLRQLWAMKWIRLDMAGIRVRNLFGVSREMTWQNIGRVEDRDIPIRKDRSFSLLTIRGTISGKEESITVDSDTVGFDVLRQLVLNAAPESAKRVSS